MLKTKLLMASILLFQSHSYAMGSGTATIVNLDQASENLNITCEDSNCDVLDVTFQDSQNEEHTRFDFVGLTKRSSLVLEYTAVAKPQNRPEWVHGLRLLFPTVRHDQRIEIENQIVEIMRSAPSTLRVDSSKFKEFRNHFFLSYRNLNAPKNPAVHY